MAALKLFLDHFVVAIFFDFFKYRTLSMANTLTAWLVLLWLEKRELELSTDSKVKDLEKSKRDYGPKSNV